MKLQLSDEALQDFVVNSRALLENLPKSQKEGDLNID